MVEYFLKVVALGLFRFYAHGEGAINVMKFHLRQANAE